MSRNLEVIVEQNKPTLLAKIAGTAAKICLGTTAFAGTVYWLLGTTQIGKFNDHAITIDLDSIKTAIIALGGISAAVCAYHLPAKTYKATKKWLKNNNIFPEAKLAAQIMTLLASAWIGQSIVGIKHPQFKPTPDPIEAIIQKYQEITSQPTRRDNILLLYRFYETKKTSTAIFPNFFPTPPAVNQLNQPRYKQLDEEGEQNRGRFITLFYHSRLPPVCNPDLIPELTAQIAENVGLDGKEFEEVEELRRAYLQAYDDAEKKAFLDKSNQFFKKYPDSVYELCIREQRSTIIIRGNRQSDTIEQALNEYKDAICARYKEPGTYLDALRAMWWTYVQLKNDASADVYNQAKYLYREAVRKGDKKTIEGMKEFLEQNGETFEE